ncbi:MAG: hypothetical protein EB088_14275 [Betaproteobacteria bacterium]|nr:hypothetical protein [Betaproteobacteria bacterium]
MRLERQAFVIPPDHDGTASLERHAAFNHLGRESAVANQITLVILDAQHLKAPALARIRLPRRVPQGFHGNWIKRSALVPTSER